MALTQENLLSFLLEHGGKVKNSELLNNFRNFINCGDPAEKQHNRDLFKRLVNSVAVVKQIDEVKFVVVKKRYQDFVKEVPGEVSQKTQVDDSFSSHDSSFSSYASPRRAESGREIYPDNKNNNACRTSSTVSHRRDAEQTQESLQKNKQLSSTDATAVKVLNIRGDQSIREGKSGAVFAVIAVKSPPRHSAPTTTPEGLYSQEDKHERSDKSIPKVSQLPGLTSNLSACQRDSLRESQCWKARQAGDIETPGSPLMRPQNKSTRQADDAKYCESVPLEPRAHEWLVKCAAGLWGQIHALLLRDTRLAQKKDFMSGFTALHWAAKDGNVDIIHQLMGIPSKRGTSVNVNSKAHGGYTPLHIAAIHGHAEVMVLLVERYGANVNERDNDGKKALHYLGKGAPAEVRALLGGLLQGREKTEGEEDKEHTKGFNTISKLFHPHVGRKQKTTKFANEW